MLVQRHGVVIAFLTSIKRHNIRTTFFWRCFDARSLFEQSRHLCWPTVHSLLGIFNLILMGNNPRASFFTDFSCGLLFCFVIEGQASNSSAQSTKGNRVIPFSYFLLTNQCYLDRTIFYYFSSCFFFPFLEPFTILSSLVTHRWPSKQPT